MSRRLELTVSDETWARLDVARGHEPRASFVKRALEEALGAGGPAETERMPSVASPGSASPRAPVSTGVVSAQSGALGKGFVPPRPKGKS